MALDPLGVGRRAGIDGWHLENVSARGDSPGHDSDLDPFSVLADHQGATTVTAAGRDISTGSAHVGLAQGIAEGWVDGTETSQAHVMGQDILLGCLQGQRDGGEDWAAVRCSPTEEGRYTGRDDTSGLLSDRLNVIVEHKGIIDADLKWSVERRLLVTAIR